MIVSTVGLGDIFAGGRCWRWRTLLGLAGATGAGGRCWWALLALADAAGLILTFFYLSLILTFFLLSFFCFLFFPSNLGFDIMGLE